MRKRSLRRNREKEMGVNEFHPFCGKCGSEMVKRIRRSDGHPFWGCPNYPACMGTKEIKL
jgi:ssDNA-binding Zn-finger/Zn-ribbon topoisomerase 1